MDVWDQVHELADAGHQIDERYDAENADWLQAIANSELISMGSTNASSLDSTAANLGQEDLNNISTDSTFANFKTAWDSLHQVTVLHPSLATFVRESEFPPVFKYLVDLWYERLNAKRINPNQSSTCGLSIKGKSGCFLIKDKTLNKVRLIKPPEKKTPTDWELTIIVPYPDENTEDLPMNILFPTKFGFESSRSTSKGGGRVAKKYVFTSTEQSSTEKETLEIHISGQTFTFPIKIYTSRSSKTKNTYFEFEASFL